MFIHLTYVEVKETYYMSKVGIIGMHLMCISHVAYVLEVMPANMSIMYSILI